MTKVIDTDISFDLKFIFKLLYDRKFLNELEYIKSIEKITKGNY